MKKNSVIIIGLVLLLLSCGNKVASDADVIKTIDSYRSKVDNDQSLTKETTEGALTDEEGYEDIGRFEYSVFFNQNPRALYKITNKEITDQTISESYYFQDHNLVFIEKTNSGSAPQKMYTKGDKNVLSSSEINDDDIEVLLKKARRFKNAFYRSE
ncbi:hypothetical protein ACU8DI_02815 [Psychroserpens sp. BH13MA-6]